MEPNKFKIIVVKEKTNSAWKYWASAYDQSLPLIGGHGYFVLGVGGDTKAEALDGCRRAVDLLGHEEIVHEEIYPPTN